MAGTTFLIPMYFKIYTHWRVVEFKLDAHLTFATPCFFSPTLSLSLIISLLSLLKPVGPSYQAMCLHMSDV